MIINNYIDIHMQCLGKSHLFVLWKPSQMSILGKNIPRNLKQTHIQTAHHILFYMFVLYLVK